MDLRKILVGVLSVAIVSPAWGGGEPLGSITSSQNATVRDTKLMTGSTLFNGDVISVGEHGASQIALSGGAQAEILASSLVRIMKADNKIRIAVGGQASFHTSGATNMELMVADATVRSGDNGASSAVIQSLSNTHAVIAAEKGALVFTTAHDGKSYTLREGEAADLSVAREEQQGGGPAPAGKSAPRGVNNKKAVIWTVVILSAGVAIAAYLLVRREVQLSPTQLGNEISPTKLQ
jgi:hypothetical protein